MNYKLLFFFLFLHSIGIAQNVIQVKGVVKNKDGAVLSNATVVLVNLTLKDSAKTNSNELGIFSFDVIRNSKIKLFYSYIGYTLFVKELEIKNNNEIQNIEDVFLEPNAGMLGNVTVESQKIQIKEDTVSYLIDSTMYRKNDNVESMLKNLPGVQVDKEGTITAQGKQVTRVKVNGKEFFNGDVTTATREINADMVDRIQIIDDYGDQSAFTGIKDGDPTKTMNIQLRKDKNKGYFGNSSVGAGTNDRYLSSLSINKFNNEQQISLFGNLNNTNVNLFNFGSMGGAMGNTMGNSSRSMGTGRGGAGSSTGSIGGSDGINTTKSVGLNYRDEWGSKISVYGSCSFSNKLSNTIKNSTQQNIYQTKTSAYLLNSENNSIVQNQRFSFNIEYKMDTMNYIKFNPTVSYNHSDVDYFSDFNSFLDATNISSGTIKDKSISNTPNISGSLLYNHRFKKRGRTMSLNINSGNSTTDSNEGYGNLTNLILPNGNIVDSLLSQKIIQGNSNENYGAKLSYTEPLNKKRSLEFNYSFNKQQLDNDRKNFLIDSATQSEEYVASLSNIYNNKYETNKFGLNLKTTQKKYNYSLGFSAQPARIESNSITSNSKFVNKLVNYYPVVRVAYNFSKSRSLNINYNGSSNQPSNAQLQPVIDNSNPQFISIGNPDLKPEFTSNVNVRYNNFDYISGNVFFGNFTANYTQDKIVNSVKLIRNGVQQTTYKNANGYYTFSGFYNISRPIQNRKYVFNVGGNVSYINNISFLRDSNDLESKNIGSNWLASQRLSVDIKIKKWLETTVSVNYGLNDSKNSYQSDLNSNTKAWTLSNNSRFFLPKDFIISYDLEKIFNSGYANNVITSPFIINTTIEKQFFEKKNVSLKLQGLDLLNENIGVNRTISGTGFTDTRTNKLGRYFIMSLVFRLNKFFNQQQNGLRPEMPGGGDRGEMRGMRHMGF